VKILLISLAVLFVLAGLAVAAYVVFIFIAFSQWGSNK
jgi:phage shock protein PspC (stress-responsive transcriptional regulator)